ncbi:BP74-related protein [Nostoc mirabile]|uniref:BP74-related protein n=1 Tax=Nostoc mirabile TaxID=2907820 RepID=UPI003FD89249
MFVNPNTIEQVKYLQAGKSNATIPNGRIYRGAGEGNHNAPYSWHLDPQEIVMAEAAIEVCDARPSYVEAHVDEFVDNVTRFCPWETKLVNVEDLREGITTDV